MKCRVLVAALIVAPSQFARAATCDIEFSPMPSTVHLGCPLTLWVRDIAARTYTPGVLASRGGPAPQVIDVTGTITRIGELLPVGRVHIDSSCAITDSFGMEPYQRFTIDLLGAEVGDVLHFEDPDWIGSSMVVAPTGCAPPQEPDLVCMTEDDPPCMDQGSGSDRAGEVVPGSGCATTDAAGERAAIALATLAVCACRIRNRRPRS